MTSVEEVRKKNKGSAWLHQTGRCCRGSSPLRCAAEWRLLPLSCGHEEHGEGGGAGKSSTRGAALCKKGIAGAGSRACWARVLRPPLPVPWSPAPPVYSVAWRGVAWRGVALCCR
jgi:hypothetical protein